MNGTAPTQDPTATPTPGGSDWFQTLTADEQARQLNFQLWTTVAGLVQEQGETAQVLANVRELLASMSI